MSHTIQHTNNTNITADLHSGPSAFSSSVLLENFDVEKLPEVSKVSFLRRTLDQPSINSLASYATVAWPRFRCCVGVAWSLPKFRLQGPSPFSCVPNPWFFLSRTQLHKTQREVMHKIHFFPSDGSIQIQMLKTNLRRGWRNWTLVCPFPTS